MALCIFNPTTLENRLATEEELAALYARSPAESPAPEADRSLSPRPQKENDPPPTSDSQNSRPNTVLSEDQVLIDWETHLYDFATRQVLPIHIPLSQQFNDLRETLGGEIVRLESRINSLEGRLVMLEAPLTALSTATSPSPEADCKPPKQASGTAPS